VKWLIWALLVATGILIGWLAQAAQVITVSSSVDAGNVLEAVATLVVAILIGYLYTEHASSKKADTDTLQDCVRDIKRAFRRVEEAARACEGGHRLSDSERSALTLADRELSNTIHSLEEGLKLCRVKLHAVEIGKLKDARTELKERLTDSPFPGPYDPASCAGILSALRGVRDELMRISIAINHR